MIPPKCSNHQTECKKGVRRLHTTFTSCQNSACSNGFFPYRVYHILGSMLWLSKCDFCRLFHTERSWHSYWFSAVIVSGRHDLPSDARAFPLTSFDEQCSLSRQSQSEILTPIPQSFCKWNSFPNYERNALIKKHVNNRSRFIVLAPGANYYNGCQTSNIWRQNMSCSRTWFTWE